MPRALLWYFMGGVLTMYLLLNIISSQFVSSLYFGLVNNDRDAIRGFLTRIKILPEFKSEMEKYKNILGASIEDEVYQHSVEVQEAITRLEDVSDSGVRSKDIYYSLYLLYNEIGNQNRAQEYLRRARSIDPSIK
jgi:tetratricopeptide (TPR) repeat protein